VSAGSRWTSMDDHSEARIIGRQSRNCSDARNT
jgi:hypothetical protein